MLCRLKLLLKQLQTRVGSRDSAKRAVVQFVERFTKTVYHTRTGDANFYIAGIPKIRNCKVAAEELADRAAQGEQLIIMRFVQRSGLYVLPC